MARCWRAAGLDDRCSPGGDHVPGRSPSSPPAHPLRALGDAYLLLESTLHGSGDEGTILDQVRFVRMRGRMRSFMICSSLSLSLSLSPLP